VSDLFDLAESRALRDAALARVSSNAGSFIERGLAAISLLPGGEYTGAMIRHALILQEIAPHHCNAWGALVRSAIHRGLLHPTGRFTPSISKKNHAHRTEVYTK